MVHPESKEIGPVLSIFLIFLILINVRMCNKFIKHCIYAMKCVEFFNFIPFGSKSNPAHLSLQLELQIWLGCNFYIFFLLRQIFLRQLHYSTSSSIDLQLEINLLIISSTPSPIELQLGINH